MPSETTIQRYRDGALALLPPGRAISKSPDSNVGKLLEALSVDFARLDELGEALLLNVIPSTADEMIDEWEDALGLPGSCIENPSTVLSDRQAYAAAKLRGGQDHSVTNYELVATSLGYTDDIEYVRYEPFTAGASAAGSNCYGDEWANHVTINVETSDQTADEELQCIWQDELRRAHGHLSIYLEGPMGASRTFSTSYLNANNLGASITEGSITGMIELKYQGFLSVQCVLTAGGTSPIGTWTLWSSTDGVTFSQLSSAAVTTEFTSINPAGSSLSGFATFQNVPGRYVKVAYTRTSGGGSGCSCTLHLASW